MTENEFNVILASAGIMSAKARKKLWNSRPTDELSERPLRVAAKAALAQFPEVGFPDPKEVE